ncbi:MAG: alpha/beta hydrolase [Planctomycetota bacterium]
MLLTPLLSLLLIQNLVPTYTDIAYGAKPAEKLDVYISPSAVPTPAVIEFHPGGWSSGGKSQFSVYGRAIEKIYNKGITIISIDYPLAPAELYPAQNLSCLRAVQFVRANASLWNIDKNNIGGIGASAGAQLAMWVSMAPDAANPSSADPVLHESSRLRAVVSVSGPSDFTTGFYKHNPAVSAHGSPVWAYFGVSNQQQWDAIPQSTKQAASARWLASGAEILQNKNVSVLCVHEGDPNVVAASELPLPVTNVHDLVQGMIFTETLQSIGNPDASLWVGASIEDPLGSYYPGVIIADWFRVRFNTNRISNFGFGTPGCFGYEYLLSNEAASLGNINFRIQGYLGLANSLGALIISTAKYDTILDPFAIGLRLSLDFNSPELIAMDVNLDNAGNFTLNVAVPPNPVLSGQTFYAQAITSWNGPGAPVGCNPSLFKLSSTNLLRIQIP